MIICLFMLLFDNNRAILRINALQIVPRKPRKVSGTVKIPQRHRIPLWEEHYENSLDHGRDRAGRKLSF